MKIEAAREAYLENPGQLLLDSAPDASQIADFIKSKSKKGVIGLSGGVDSSLVAALAVKALGKENVLGIAMPAGNQPIDLEYAEKIAGKLGINALLVDIRSVADACNSNYPKNIFGDKLGFGNLKARLRMAHLYEFARQFKGDVLGTGNKSELMVGYFTKYGDGGVDILPLGQLYKTQVWKMAADAGVPEEIIKRPPTAGLWPSQTDEGELGITYANLDKILLGHELGFDIGRISQVTGMPEKTVDQIFARIAANRHKLEMPPMPEPKFYGGKASHNNAVLTVDAIIKYNGNYVFIQRGHEPFKGMLAFPGGHVEEGQTCEDAVLAEVQQETGLEFKIKGQLGAYSDLHRDPRGKYVTIVFCGEGAGMLKAGDDASDVVLLKKSEVIPEKLAFDHGKIWEDYKKWHSE